MPAQRYGENARQICGTRTAQAGRHCWVVRRGNVAGVATGTYSRTAILHYCNPLVAAGRYTKGALLAPFREVESTGIAVERSETLSTEGVRGTPDLRAAETAR